MDVLTYALCNPFECKREERTLLAIDNDGSLSPKVGEDGYVWAEWEETNTGKRLIDGEIYTIVMNHNEPISGKCFAHTDTAFYIGNPSFCGYGGDNGEIYCIWCFCDSETGEWTIKVKIRDSVTILKVSYTETHKLIAEQYLPDGIGGGLPEVDFGLLDTEDGVTFGAQFDPNLVLNHTCFLGEFVVNMSDGATAQMSLLFTYMTPNMAWSGYMHTAPDLGSIELFGTVIVQFGMGIVQITMNMPTA